MEFIHIGHSAKSRGINGNFKTRIEKKYVEDLLKARAVFILINGSKVPFLIESATDNGDVILKLEEVDSPEAVSKYLSKELYLDLNEVSQENIEAQSDTNPLIGYTIIDQNDEAIGPIDALLEYPDQLLAKLSYNGKEVLIPIHEDLILDINEEQQQLKLTIIEGLLDL